MKKIFLFLVIFLFGFFTKATVTELKKFHQIKLMDSCIADLEDPDEPKGNCYVISESTRLGVILSILDFQPQFYKNLDGRCEQKEIEARGDYFQCHWWNKL